MVVNCVLLLGDFKSISIFSRKQTQKTCWIAEFCIENISIDECCGISNALSKQQDFHCKISEGAQLNVQKLVFCSFCPRSVWLGLVSEKKKVKAAGVLKQKKRFMWKSFEKERSDTRKWNLPKKEYFSKKFKQSKSFWKRQWFPFVSNGCRYNGESKLEVVFKLLRSGSTLVFPWRFEKKTAWFPCPPFVSLSSYGWFIISFEREIFTLDAIAF